MSTGKPLTFRMPEGWTVRKVAVALAKEWLQPFRAETTRKSARWILQAVINRDTVKGPIWEPGIPTREYEARLEDPDLAWNIRATVGRGRNTILAKLTNSEDQPETFELECTATSFPETLFDAEKLSEFMEEQGSPGTEELLCAVLRSQGFQLVDQGA